MTTNMMKKKMMMTTTILFLILRVVSLSFAVLGKQMDTEGSTDFAKSENRKLIVTTQLQPPYMLLKQHGNFLAGNERFEGFIADILDRLATSVGFEYEIRLSRDFGRLSDGMIQEVYNGLADMAAGLIIPPKASTSPPVAIDFTEPFLSFRVSALIHRNQGSLRGQGQGVVSNALQALNSDFTYGVIQYGPVHRMMSNSTDPVIRALWTRVANFWPPGFVSSVQEGVERARREHYAFLVETPTAEYVASRRPCDLYASDPFLDVMSYAFVTRREDQRLRDTVSRALRRLKQTDELQNLYLKWWRDDCGGHSASGRRSSSPEVEPRRRPDATRPPLSSLGVCHRFGQSCHHRTAALVIIVVYSLM